MIKNVASESVSRLDTDSRGVAPILQRKNIRAEFHDYSGGVYFITICTRDKVHYFGIIVTNVGTHGACVRGQGTHGACVQMHDTRCSDYRMEFTLIGKYCHEQLKELSTHYPYAEIPLFVVMPNHIHAIIRINNSRTHDPCVPTKRTALSVVIGGFKRAVTMYARRNNIEFGWQSRYYDHIIRGRRDGNMISEYIQNNVASWANDCFYR